LKTSVEILLLSERILEKYLKLEKLGKIE